MAEDESTQKRSKNFEALTPELAQWILDFTSSMGFSRTTPVQGMAIPLLLGNKDLVVEVSSLTHLSITQLIVSTGCDWQWQNAQLSHSSG